MVLVTLTIRTDFVPLVVPVSYQQPESVGECWAIEAHSDPSPIRPNMLGIRRHTGTFPNAGAGLDLEAAVGIEPTYGALQGRYICAVAGVRGAGVPDSYRILSGALWGLEARLSGYRVGGFTL